MNSILYVANPSAPTGYAEASFEEILEGARAAIARRFRRGMEMTAPSVVRSYLMANMADREHEVFSVILLDNRHRLIAVRELFRGTVDGASVHPREVVKEALKHNASAVLFAHNHPSGVAEPSQADQLITLRLRDALALVDIRTLDHLIVGGSQIISLAERGVL